MYGSGSGTFIAGTGTRVLGGVLAQNSEIQNNSLAGNTVVSYSSCSISNALKSAASVTPLGGRSWTQRY
ncbi:MAG TPA: hypothetical protein VM094_00475 [Gemmatimonadales bacterium]|nr:hypothetical protein [Gemmatimonadales bacterium]